ncbi:MAG TPA: EthD domain-containing protein [Noviherbaspirillum sp.]|uniref:EthD domain-containing protein n=1 Tax=Noviherbaspirillum sp. TaxID=1926288 RepID=UPI002B499771|nr:EthD domain-containing protein [Noviherbaspirillum sp.]HJV86895.1 EthD domain-containing protein [Noviherbaspirillum sp.]
MASATAVSTIALLIRKDGISPSLFSRYWRDVHGVLAARIPGFESYLQFHLDEPMGDVETDLKNTGVPISQSVRFDGVAEVLFNKEQDRAGLATSAVAALIQEDERNVFQTSLLYNLAPGASRTHVDRLGQDGKSAAERPDTASVFLLIGRRAGHAGEETASAIEQILLPMLSDHAAILKLRSHVLISGDPLWWSPAGVQHTHTPDATFDVVVQIVCPDQRRLKACLTEVFSAVGASLFQRIGNIQVCPVRAAYRMVDGGRPTQLGLRGLDVMQTIDALDANNQRQDAVLNCIYGVSAAAS